MEVDTDDDSEVVSIQLNATPDNLYQRDRGGPRRFHHVA